MNQRSKLRQMQKGIFRSMKILSVAVLSFVITALPVFAEGIDQTSGWNFQQTVQQVLSQIQQQGAVGVLAFVVLYVVATVAFIPGSLLTLGAGVVYGVVQGSCYVFIGASLGAILAFLVGRYIARDWVAKKIHANSKFEAIDEAVKQEGFKIVLLTRLSPVFPFNLLNYAFGITAVSLRDYALGCVGMIPFTILYVYVGSLAGSLASLDTSTESATPVLQWTLRGIGFAATIAVTLYITRLARKALAESVPEAKISQNFSSDS